MEHYELIRSRRKSLALEITPEGCLLVRAPLRLSKARIEAFVAAHDAWIEKHLELQRRRAAQRPPAPTAEEVEALKEQARRLLPLLLLRRRQKNRTGSPLEAVISVSRIYEGVLRTRQA